MMRPTARGRRSGMEYARQRHNGYDDVYSILLRRRGVTMRFPFNDHGFFLDEI